MIYYRVSATGVTLLYVHNTYICKWYIKFICKFNEDKWEAVATFVYVMGG